METKALAISYHISSWQLWDLGLDSLLRLWEKLKFSPGRVPPGLQKKASNAVTLFWSFMDSVVPRHHFSVLCEACPVNYRGDETSLASNASHTLILPSTLPFTVFFTCHDRK